MKRLLFLLVTMTACIAAWAAEGYAVYTQSNHTLTFYYGTKPSGAFGLNSGINYPEWYNYGTYAAVERVVHHHHRIELPQYQRSNKYAWNVLGLQIPHLT